MKGTLCTYSCTSVKDVDFANLINEAGKFREEQNAISKNEDVNDINNLRTEERAYQVDALLLCLLAMFGLFNLRLQKSEVRVEVS